MTALIRRNLIHRNAIHQTRHILMKIPTGTERLNQRLITRKISHNTQLNLRIIRTQQRLKTLTGHKSRTNLTTSRITIRNILQIRINRTQPTSRSHSLLKRRMNTTIRPVRRINQRLHNLLKLILLTMQQQRIKKLTSPIITIRTITQHLQSSRIRSIRTSLSLLRRLQAHILKQNLLQLLRTLQIHALARILPCRFLRVIRVGGKLFAHAHQPVHIDLRTGMLHVVQHAGYWNLHRFKQ